jgi:hypothetical protein
MGDGASLGFANRRYVQIERAARPFAAAPSLGAGLEHRVKTFIRTAEIWVLSKDRTQLVFGGGLYGPLDAFGTGSETLRFEFDEGLPGKAWAAGHPVILKDFTASGFERAAAAKAAGLTCAVALPVFAGELLMAVVVFFCGDDDTHVGALEL